MMKPGRIRQVVAFEHHFEEFLQGLDQRTQDKIFKILEVIETQERIPGHYLKHLAGYHGLYEARIQLGSNIWRVFCFFDGDRLVILLNGFQKKSQKTPKIELEKASKLMQAYHQQKRK